MENRKGYELLNDALLDRLEKEAVAIETAINKALDAGYRTADIGGGANAVGCEKMGEIIAGNII